MTRSRLLAASGGALLLLLIGLAAVGGRSSAPAPAAPRPAPAFDLGIPTAQEVRNMLGVYGERVEGAERGLRELQAGMEETRKALDESSRRHEAALERLARELRVPEAPKPAPGPPPAPRFRTFEFDRARPRSLQLPAGSFGEATLLTGVYAPVTGEPLPVLLRLDAALVGPGRTRVPLEGAFLVGKAQGDVNSRRATVQLDTLSAAGTDGRAADARVNGWIVDEDGIQGLRGIYVWRAEEVLALSTLAGALSGGSEAAAARETTVQATPLGGSQSAVTGDPYAFAGYRALASAFGRLGDVVGRRAQEIVPAVYVPNGRSVTVAFIQGATLEGYVAPAGPASPFEGLDR
jgi:hypothetical protein